MANKLDLEINSSQAKSELAGLKAELAQLIQQAQTLKSALSDATGTQRGVIQGALAGTMNRIGALNTSLETAQTSSVIGGVANNPAAAAGVLPSGGFGAGGTGASGVISVSGVAPMNPGTAAGQFGASGYTPTMRFAPGMQPGIAAPVQPTVMMGLPAFVSAAQIAATPTVQMPAQQTIAFTPQQAAAAAYGVPPSGGGQSFFGNSRRYNFGVFVGSVALAGAESAGGFIEYQAQRERVGGVDYTAQGRNVSSSISAAAGAIAFGATGNPYIGALVYGASNAILGPIADKITAPWQNRADANVSLAGFFGSR
ncbi:MAG TPA: hypothetical protein VNH18_09200, partial [Bryobacteraceae bacterium]|nr:hypothetical protein [Bryobacteraceae bacterium]